MISVYGLFRVPLNTFPQFTVYSSADLSIGTWMDSDNGIINEGTWVFPKWELQTPSNVTRIGRAMLAEDAEDHPQIVYYQGTPHDYPLNN